MLVAALTRLQRDGDGGEPLLDPEAEELLEDSRTRAERRLAARERVVELLVGAAFLAAAGALAALVPWQRSFDAPLAAGLVVGYAVAARVKFEIGAGCTDATQVMFVPILLLLPPPLAPLLVAGAYLLGELPDYLAGRRHPERLVVTLGNAWYAIGPALVLGLAGGHAPALGHWAVYLWALLAQFSFDTVAAILRDWLERGVRPARHLALAGWRFGVDGLLSAVGLLAAIAAADDPMTILLVLPLVSLLALFAREREARLDSALQLSDAYRGTTMVLADLVESDDEYTGLHSRTVVQLALEVAAELRLSARQRRNVEFGALLHDIGKIAVPKDVINKPGPLTPAEWALIKVHTIDGQRMLERVGGVLKDVGRTVRSSHERWDGQGYPDGLAGGRIPIEARVVACCDAFSAMTTDRPYRSALPLEKALAELRANAGTQFDPAVAEALARLVQRQAPAQAPRPAATPASAVPVATLPLSP